MMASPRTRYPSGQPLSPLAEDASTTQPRSRCWSLDSYAARAKKMSKVCKQVSIESPGPIMKDCIFSFDVPVPDVPPRGARLKVMCAGVCYRSRRSLSGNSSFSSSAYSIEGPHLSVHSLGSGSPVHYQGVRDTSLFPGYEVAGEIDAFGEEVTEECGFNVGDRVIVYPYEGCPEGYAEYISVRDVEYLVRIPPDLPLPVAAMLPSGGLWAMNTLFTARSYIERIMKDRPDSDEKCKVLLVGTGGFAMFAMRLAGYYWPEDEDRVTMTVAVLKEEALKAIPEEERDTTNFVCWFDDLYENQLIERTIDACEGRVDVVIDFAANPRSLNRSLQCLSPGGVIVIGAETGHRLVPRYEKRAEENQVKIVAVDLGTIDQLRDLVGLVSCGEIEPPPYTVFPSEKAEEVILKLSKAKIKGRAILKFSDF